MNISESNCFRFTGTVGQFSTGAFENGVRYTDGIMTASSNLELEKLFVRHGINEMFARINTTTDIFGVDTEEDAEDGLKNGLMLCEIAKQCDIPINIELTCAEHYMDMSIQEAPEFRFYPEANALQKGKTWQELTIEEACEVIRKYGEMVAGKILSTGVRVSCWNLGNEANFGFAGVSVGLKTAINPKLEEMTPMKMYMIPTYGSSWLKGNCWNYDAILMRSLQEGIRKADPTARFSTHIATVIADYHSAAAFFKTLFDNGVTLDCLGLSIYPSAPSQHLHFETFYHKMVDSLYEKFSRPIYIAEYAYPALDMTSGGFAGWNKVAAKIPHTEDGQYELARLIISWGGEKTRYVVSAFGHRMHTASKTGDRWDYLVMKKRVKQLIPESFFLTIFQNCLQDDCLYSESSPGSIFWIYCLFQIKSSVKPSKRI